MNPVPRLHPILPGSPRRIVTQQLQWVVVHRTAIALIGFVVVDGGESEGRGMAVGKKGGMIEVKAVVGILDSGFGPGLDGYCGQIGVMGPTSSVDHTLLSVIDGEWNWVLYIPGRGGHVADDDGDGDGGETRL